MDVFPPSAARAARARVRRRRMNQYAATPTNEKTTRVTPNLPPPDSPSSLSVGQSEFTTSEWGHTKASGGVSSAT